MADQEQIRELGTVIRDEIKRHTIPSAQPGVVAAYGATEHDIARAAISYFEDTGWVPPNDEPPGEGAQLTSDESSAIYDAYRTGDDALRLQGVVESITQRAYAQGLLDERRKISQIRKVWRRARIGFGSGIPKDVVNAMEEVLDV